MNILNRFRHTIIMALVVTAVVFTTRPMKASGLTVYVMSSSFAPQDQAVLSALTDAGHIPTLGVELWQWDGSQANLNSYNAVVILNSAYYNDGDMPESGQLALLGFVESGGGLVTGEWLVWSVDQDHIYKNLAPMMPSHVLEFRGGVGETTYFEVNHDPVISNGVSTSFLFPKKNVSAGNESVLIPKKNATVFYGSSHTGESGVIGWDYCIGRVINFSTLITELELAYPDYERLFTNAVDWTTRSTRTSCYADLSVNVDAFPTPSSVGLPLVYSVSIDNHGPTDATGLIFEDLLSGYAPTVGRSVYVMSSADAQQDQAVLNALSNGGHIPTLGVELWQWDGSQADLSDYDTVLILYTANYHVADMPGAGQNALLNYVQNSGGLVTGEWFAWGVDQDNRFFEELVPLMPSHVNNFYGGNETTYSVVNPNSILNYGVSSSFHFPLSRYAGGSESSLIPKTDATVFYWSSNSNSGGVVGWDFYSGRVVNFSTLMSHVELSSPDYAQLLSNAIGWASNAGMESTDVSLMDISSSQGSCTGDSGRVLCEIGVLGSGASATIDITIIPNRVATLSNLSRASSSTWDSDESNNIASVDTSVTAGANVLFQPEDTTTFTTPVAVTFSEVTYFGDVFLTTLSSGPAAPTGFQLGDPATYYDLSTSVVYSGPIEICIDYSAVSYVDENDLRLFHYEEGEWTDTTTGIDPETDTICGSASSFSLFAIFASENHPPIADAGGPYTVDEGDSIQLDGSGSADTEQDTTALALEWDLDGDGEYDDATGISPEFSAAELGGPETATVGLKVTDDHGESATDTAVVEINNVSPTILTITVPWEEPVNFNEQASFSVEVEFEDPAEMHDEPYCEFDFDGDGIIDTGRVPATYEDFGTCSAPFDYTEPGVYTVGVIASDKDGGSDSTTAADFIVVYNPEGGFVTGGGWIISVESACPVFCNGATGKASFGFVSKYKKGAQVPTGNTQFNFKAGDLNFHSNDYEWLVVNQNGTNAHYKGIGTINGEGNYKFMLWASDGETDTFRIKIWYEDGGEVVVYDNGFDQPIGSGNIVVHTGK